MAFLISHQLEESISLLMFTVNTQNVSDSINLSQLVSLYPFELFVECPVFTVSASVSL